MTMRPLRATNSGASTLSSGITSTATSLSVASAATFPTPPFLITIGSEVLRVGAVSGTTFSSLLRGQEGTTAATHSSGATVEHRWTAGTLRGVYDLMGLVHIARQTNEVSTNSNTTVTLMTFTGLSIPASVPIMVTGMARKGSGAAVTGQLGFGLNTKDFNPVGSSDTQQAVWSSTTTDRVEQGGFMLVIPPRRTNYLQAAWGEYLRMAPGVDGARIPTFPAYGTDMPTDIITEFRIRGRTDGSTLVSVFVRDVHLYLMLEADK